MNIRISSPDGTLMREIKLLDGIDDWTPVMARVAVILHSAVRENFKEGGRPEKWKPLNEKYKQDKAEAGYSDLPLTRTSRLVNSIQPNYGKDYAMVSTNLIYAAIHHFGGTIKPKLPSRPYLLPMDEDIDDIELDLRGYINKRLGLE